MKKFFLFRSELEETASGLTSSNSGEGIAALSIPADSLSYMTSNVGSVVITFNEATSFERTFLKEGESLPKTSITVKCKEGDEVLLMEQILNFISSDSKKSVMRFDNVDRNSTFSAFEEDIKAKTVIPTLAVETATGEISQGDEADKYNNIIAGIDFKKNLPSIDYNHEGLGSFSDTDTITGWKSSGTAKGYNISTVSGSITCVDPSVNVIDKLNHKSANMPGSGAHFVVPTFEQNEDYLLYIVYGSQYGAASLDHFNRHGYPMYGDADGSCFGPSGIMTTDGLIGNANPTGITFTQEGASFVSFRHSKSSAYVQPTPTLKPFPVLGPEGNRISAQVLVVRRDTKNVIHVYDSGGRKIAQVNPGTNGVDKYNPSAPSNNNQDANLGPLKIERLGTTNESPSGLGKATLARFGVIDHDPGPDFASKLAQDLFKLYHKP